MKKLSEFEDEQAFEVIADLLTPIYNILVNEENQKLSDKSFLEILQGFLKNTPKEMMNIFAILSETPLEIYHCDAIEIVKNITILADDKELEKLFITQK